MSGNVPQLIRATAVTIGDRIPAPTASVLKLLQHLTLT
jgi:hypothetical protein